MCVRIAAKEGGIQNLLGMLYSPGLGYLQQGDPITSAASFPLTLKRALLWSDPSPHKGALQYRRVLYCK